MRPPKPKINGAPGLHWQPRANHWVAAWVARWDIVERGYTPKTQRLWPPSAMESPTLPDAKAVRLIQSECQRLQAQMLTWANGGAPDGVYEFDGTLGNLIDCYSY
jgi:hypothetical protein